MHRRPTLRAALLVFLLLLMQQAAQWHALDHLGAWLQNAHERALHVPAPDGPCAICALFAGGATAIPSEATPPVPPSEAAPDVFSSTQSLIATAAPSSNLIRAPPALL
jgi:hypothetical protein